MKKLCIMCKHFYFNTGEPGYSEETPGYDAEMGCHRDLIEIDLMNTSTDSYRKSILTADTCPEYKDYSIPDKNLVGRYCRVLESPRKGKIGKIVKQEVDEVHVQFGKWIFCYSHKEDYHSKIELCDEDYVGEPIIEPGQYMRGY